MCLFINCLIKPFFHRVTQYFNFVCVFYYLSALKECLFKILDGLWVNFDPYSKISNLCLDFCASAEVTLYPMRGLVEMARRRDYLTCIIHGKLAPPSFLPGLHFITLLLTFNFLYSYFYNFSLRNYYSIIQLLLIIILSRHQWSHYVLLFEGERMPWVSLHGQKGIFLIFFVFPHSFHLSCVFKMFLLGSMGMLWEYHRWIWSTQSLSSDKGG